MDYSLLIGIHDCDRAYQEAEQQEVENGQVMKPSHSHLLKCTVFYQATNTHFITLCGLQLRPLKSLASLISQVLSSDPGFAFPVYNYVLAVETSFAMGRVDCPRVVLIGCYIKLWSLVFLNLCLKWLVYWTRDSRYQPSLVGSAGSDWSHILQGCVACRLLTGLSVCRRAVMMRSCHHPQLVVPHHQRVLSHICRGTRQWIQSMTDMP